MAQDTSDVLALQLEKVTKKLPVLFDRDGPFYAELQRGEKDIVSSRDMRIPLKIRPGGNFGHYNPDGGSMGTGDASVYDKAIITPAFLRFAIGWTRKADLTTNDTRKSIIKLVNTRVKDAMVEFRRHADSICMTAGAGVLAVVDSVTTASSKNTIVLDEKFGAKLLRVGQTINVYNTGLTTRRTTGEGSKIEKLDQGTRKITIPTVGSLAATDKIVIGGVTATPPISIKGVPYHMNNSSTGNWLGLSRANNPEIRSNRVNASRFKISLPREAINKIGDAIGKESMSKKLKAWCHPDITRQYEGIGQVITQLNSPGESKGLDVFYGGMKKLAGAPMKESYKWDKSRIDFLDMSMWARVVMEEAQIMKIGNTRIFERRNSSGNVLAAMESFLTAAFDVYTYSPANNSYIDGLAVE